MNSRRSKQLMRYILATSVPVEHRRAVYKAVKKWWVLVPADVRRQASARMARGQMAVSLRMPVASSGAKPPKPRRKKRRPVVHASATGGGS